MGTWYRRKWRAGPVVALENKEDEGKRKGEEKRNNKAPEKRIP